MSPHQHCAACRGYYLWASVCGPETCPRCDAKVITDPDTDAAHVWKVERDDAGVFFEMCARCKRRRAEVERCELSTTKE